MELYAKGQLSFLILNCLLERDFYGLDIITEIKARTSGNVDLKKPSVYSNLTRMEKQGQVSSYMQASELGPNRRYYSITEKGRQTYQELKEEFERNHFDVFKDFRGDNEPIELNEPERRFVQETIQENVEEIESEEMEDMSDFFDFSSLDKPQPAAAKTEVQTTIDEFVTETVQEQNVEDVPEEIEETLKQDDGYFIAKEESAFVTAAQEPKEEIIAEESVKEEAMVSPVVESPAEEDKAVEEPKRDAVFLSQKDANEYNKRIYDISKDINRYRRRRSFAEDQIAISVEAPLRDSEERTKQKVEEFKNSLMENKNKYSDNRMSSETFFSRLNKEEKKEVKEEVREEIQEEDDGIFITSRMNEGSVMKARKIEPPRLKIDSPSSKDKLPPPKRDVSIDPSHKEIISRIYAKSRVDQDEEETENVLYDYDDLHGYYNKQNIKFKSYEKQSDKVCHNTNKLNFISSLIVFVMFAGLSAVAFAVLNYFGYINAKTNFLFILLPALYLIEVIYQGYNLLRHTSWEPNPMMKQIYVWGLSLILAGVIVGVNFGFGLNIGNFAQFATSIIIPLLAVVMVLPIRYYLKRSVIIRYWR